MKILATKNQKLKTVKLLIKYNNCLINAGQHCAIMDIQTGLLIAFPGDKLPYIPCGGRLATDSVCESGFVPGAELFGFSVNNLYEDLYILKEHDKR